MYYDGICDSYKCFCLSICLLALAKKYYESKDYSHINEGLHTTRA